MGLGVLVLQAAVAARYGFHRDELYFLEAGQHLAFGYVDQPPLVPALARLQSELFGDAPWALRVVPALLHAGIAVLAGLLARELGGQRRAQVWSAIAIAGAGFVLSVGHLLSTATFDFAFWLALLIVLVRLLRTGDPRWWLAFGAIAGIALWNKHLPILLTISVLGGLAAGRRRDLLWSRWLIAGGTLALVLAAPTLAWQAANDWPQLEMARALSDRIGAENRATLLPLQLLLLGPWLVPLGIAGIRRLHADGRVRPLLWVTVAVVVVTLVSGGRPYYPLPLTATLVVAGAVALAERPASRTRRWVPALLTLNVLMALPLSLPILPVSVLADTPIGDINDTQVEQLGWPELVDQVAGVIADLPFDQRNAAIVLTGSYGEAGAFDRYGVSAGLPTVYSGHNSYWHWRRPDDDRATVVAVRISRTFLAQRFARCDPAGEVDNGLGVDNEVQGAPITVCHGLQGTWEQRWPEFRHVN